MSLIVQKPVKRPEKGKVSDQVDNPIQQPNTLMPPPPPPAAYNTFLYPGNSDKIPGVTTPEHLLAMASISRHFTEKAGYERDKVHNWKEINKKNHMKTSISGKTYCNICSESRSKTFE